jgi:hypothetical protein
MLISLISQNFIVAERQLQATVADVAWAMW